MIRTRRIFKINILFICLVIHWGVRHGIDSTRHCIFISVIWNIGLFRFFSMIRIFFIFNYRLTIRIRPSGKRLFPFYLLTWFNLNLFLIVIVVVLKGEPWIRLSKYFLLQVIDFMGMQRLPRLNNRTWTGVADVFTNLRMGMRIYCFWSLRLVVSLVLV